MSVRKPQALHSPIRPTAVELAGTRAWHVETDWASRLRDRASPKAGYAIASPVVSRLVEPPLQGSILRMDPFTQGDALGWNGPHLRRSNRGLPTSGSPTESNSVSPNGAKYASPGQRPGFSDIVIGALKGAANDWDACESRGFLRSGCATMARKWGRFSASGLSCGAIRASIQAALAHCSGVLTRSFTHASIAGSSRFFTAARWRMRSAVFAASANASGGKCCLA